MLKLAAGIPAGRGTAPVDGHDDADASPHHIHGVVFGIGRGVSTVRSTSRVRRTPWSCSSSPQHARCPLFRAPSSQSLEGGSAAYESFVRKHPGGRTTIELAQASERPERLFLSSHLGSDLSKVERQARALGLTVPERSALYNRIHEAMRRVKQRHPLQSRIFKAWCMLATVLTPAALAWLVLAPSAASVVCSTFWLMTYFMCVYHARWHKGARLYRTPWLNRLTFPLYQVLEHVWAIRPSLWRKKHNGSHHVYTNDMVLDYDVASVYPFLRHHHQQPRHAFHALQWLYAPLSFSMVTLLFPLYNFLEDRTYCRPVGQLTFAAWIGVNLGLPFALHGASGCLAVLVAYALTGLMLSYFFEVSHNHPSMEHGQSRAGEPVTTMGAPERGGMHAHGLVAGEGAAQRDLDGWIAMQLAESMSWGGYFATLYTGGLNLQVEHHLAPSQDPLYYHFFRREVQQICAEEGLPYNYEPTILHAVAKYHQHLYALGRHV
mmetsp:Transcript_8166/g.30121  ORF Transcript_8166/g.30121 Transcript_8166/m.30121 type:complete len:491 (+) Transcript_8166:36-1508(+)